DRGNRGSGVVDDLLVVVGRPRLLERRPAAHHLRRRSPSAGLLARDGIGVASERPTGRSARLGARWEVNILRSDDSYGYTGAARAPRVGPRGRGHTVPRRRAARPR